MGFGYSAVAERLSYSFKKKTLSGVLERISADNHVKIAFDAQLADKHKVDGVFREASFDELLKSVLASSSFEMERIGAVYVVKPRRNDSRGVGYEVAVVKPTVELPRFKIWGTVVDQETGEKLPYAYIYTQDKKYAVTANAEGYFNLILPSSTPVTLCISYLGFEKKCVEVIPETRAGMLSINLDRANAVLSSVVVTQKQNYLVQIPNIAGKSTLNPRAASGVPALNPLDFTPSLQMLPGIDGTTESAADLSIRKSPSSQTQVLFDGFTIYHINHFLGRLSAFNTKAIKDIQIFKGGFDARYGGTASSVIEITGKSGNRYKPIFSVGVDPLSVDVSAEVPIGRKLSLVVAARRSYTDVYQTSLYSKLFDKLRNDIAEISLKDISSYNEKYSPKYHFLDLHSKLTYSPDSTQNLSLSVYGGEDNMDLLSDKKRLLLSEGSDIDNQGVGFKWSKQVGNKYFLRTSLGYSSYLLNFTHLNVSRNATLAEVARRYSALHNQLKDFTAKVECEYRFLPSAGIIAGSVFSNQNSTYSFKNYRSNQANVLIDMAKRVGSDGTSAVGYVLLDVGKGWLKTFTPGLRVTYFSPTKKAYVEPRAQISVEVAKGLIVKMAAGRYLQFINSVPMPFIGDYTSYWAVANGDSLPVISSNHFIVGFTYDATSRLQFDVESYFKRTKGLVSQVLLPSLVNQKYKLRQLSFYNSNDILGVDVLAKYLYPKGQVALAYSISQSTVFSKNLKVDDSYPANNDQEHEFKAFASHKVGRLNFSAAWIYGSGKPWDELALYNNLKVVPDYERNSRRLGSYHRLDLSASYEQRIGYSLLSVTASIFNVYDKNNEIMRPYGFSNTSLQDVSQGKSPLIYNDIYGLRFTPSLYLNLTF
ncbi:carboxypeptidase-like regulatory domain-containing protein [uncultured Acetobacteroides sp.]|uniref:TonB-dependent receptor n=1 Tax=uncultured Acetobacteroides sp. TaxID=1760811 RepID=UPI0029F5A92E|nr:carboxypeptidase-like regulatory domain-containing protein [uncultured Acetobacteroides sp.]